MSHHAALAALLALVAGPAGAAEKGAANPKLDSRALARAIDQAIDALTARQRLEGFGKALLDTAIKERRTLRTATSIVRIGRWRRQQL